MGREPQRAAAWRGASGRAAGGGQGTAGRTRGQGRQAKEAAQARRTDERCAGHMPGSHARVAGSSRERVAAARGAQGAGGAGGGAPAQPAVRMGRRPGRELAHEARVATHVGGKPAARGAGQRRRTRRAGGAGGRVLRAPGRPRGGALPCLTGTARSSTAGRFSGPPRRRRPEACRRPGRASTCTGSEGGWAAGLGLGRRCGLPLPAQAWVAPATHNPADPRPAASRARRQGRRTRRRGCSSRPPHCRACWWGRP